VAAYSGRLARAVGAAYSSHAMGSATLDFRSRLGGGRMGVGGGSRWWVGVTEVVDLAGGGVFQRGPGIRHCMGGMGGWVVE
jgi:hypothetical protein